MVVITPQKSVSQQPKEQRDVYIHLPNTEKLASSHIKGNIRAVKVMYRSLGQHDILIFELGFCAGMGSYQRSRQLFIAKRKNIISHVPPSSMKSNQRIQLKGSQCTDGNKILQPFHTTL